MMATTGFLGGYRRGCHYPDTGFYLIDPLSSAASDSLSAAELGFGAKPFTSHGGGATSNSREIDAAMITVPGVRAYTTCTGDAEVGKSP